MSDITVDTGVLEIKERLEIQKTTSEEYRTRVRRTLGIWTGAVVGLLAACVISFIVLLSSFTESAVLAVFGTIFGVILLAFGLILNSYTKRESNFLCAVKRRPLGYLMRATLGKEEIILFGIAAGLSFVGAVMSVILFVAVSAANATLIILAVVLMLTLAASIVAFLFSNKARAYVVENAEIFSEIETEFAKKSHLI